MSGSIWSPRHGVWVARIDAGRDPVTGKRRQISRTIRGSKRDAQKVLNEMAVEADRGRFTGTSTTFRQLSDRWLEMAKNDLSPLTLRRYRGLLDRSILPAIGDLPVKSIEAIDLDQLYNGLQKRAGLAPATVRQVHAIIRRAFRQAVLWGWTNTNPAANATPPRMVKPELSPPDVEEVAALLEAANESEPEFGRFLHVAATTGARRGELCALKWGNVNFSARTLTIEHSIIEMPGGGMLEKDTKTHAMRRIALDEETLAVLEDQRGVVEERAAIADLDIGDDAYVFSREIDGSTPWRPDGVGKRFRDVRDGLGLTNVRLHDLRHFAATRLIAAGVPVRTVSGRLGHADPSTTLMVYSHFVEASDQDAAIVMGSLVQRPLSAKKAVAKKAVANEKLPKKVIGNKATKGLAPIVVMAKRSAAKQSANRDSIR
jgi:integrase